MIICAIRDRMLDYFQPPVCVNRIQDLMAAIAKGINDHGATQHEIGQAPDHYELWKIGEVDDQGNVHANREYITNCASFVRNGVWKRRTEGASGAESESGSRQGRSEGARGPTGAGTGPAAGTQGTEALKAPKPRSDAGGGHPGDLSDAPTVSISHLRDAVKTATD